MRTATGALSLRSSPGTSALAAAWSVLAGRARRRCTQRRQAGFSATELLVFTAPLCVLSMVITSKLAATSSARIRAGWMASLAAQQGASRPCGGNPRLNAPFHPEADPGLMNAMPTSFAIYGLNQIVDHQQSKVVKVLEGWSELAKAPRVSRTASRVASVKTGAFQVAGYISTIAPLLFTVGTFFSTIPADIMTSPELVESNWATQRVSVPLDSYHFRRAADAAIGGPSAVSASASFVCNEPDDGDSVREDKRGSLIAQAVIEASGIYY